MLICGGRGHPNLSSPRGISPNFDIKPAFTMAEVLITIGIIGIVIAMTLPALIQKYRNKVVETRLVYFYSVINQAIRISESVNGDKTYWFQNADNWNEDHTENGKLVWLETYLLPYLDGVTCRFTKEISATNPVCYFKAGGAFMSVNGGTGDVANNQDWLFWPGDPLKCWPVREGTSGVCVFAFFILLMTKMTIIQPSFLNRGKLIGMEKLKLCIENAGILL